MCKPYIRFPTSVVPGIRSVTFYLKLKKWVSFNNLRDCSDLTYCCVCDYALTSPFSTKISSVSNNSKVRIHKVTVELYSNIYYDMEHKPLFFQILKF